MNTKHIRKFVIGTVFSLFVMPVTGFSHETTDPLHPIPIETIDSRLAYPVKVHVQVTDAGLEIKGILKRKGHNNKTLRGHVDVEVIDSAGKVLESKKVSISSRKGSSKHDHGRDFSTVLALPEGEEEYSVRVSHVVGGHDH